jgi:hypothetical protein
MEREAEWRDFFGASEQERYVIVVGRYGRGLGMARDNRRTEGKGMRKRYVSDEGLRIRLEDGSHT